MEKEKRAINSKAMFYFEQKLKCHIKKIPIGFINGKIKSSLQNNTFYWFEDLRKPGKQIRLFVDEIFDIKDYEEVIG